MPGIECCPRAQCGFSRALALTGRLRHPLIARPLVQARACGRLHEPIGLFCGPLRLVGRIHRQGEGLGRLRFLVERLRFQLLGVLLGQPLGRSLVDVAREAGAGHDVTGRLLGSFGLGHERLAAADVEPGAPLDLLQREGHQIIVERLIEVVADRQLLKVALPVKDEFLAIGARPVRLGYFHDAAMRLAGWAAFHAVAVLAGARNAQHIAAVDVRYGLSYALLGECVLHSDARLAVLRVDGAGEGALEDADDHRQLGRGHAVNMEHALLAVASAGEAGLLLLPVNDVEDVIVGRAHREVEVLGPSEGIEPPVVAGAEHIVPPHAVMAFAAEVEGLPVRMHEGEVLILVGVDVSGQFHRRGEGAVRKELGAVDVAARGAILAIAAEIDGARPFGQVDYGALLALLVQRGLQLLREHHDFASDIGQVIEPEEVGIGHLHLAAHGDLLEAAEQAFAIAALLLKGLHGPCRDGLLLGGAEEALVGNLGLLEPVVEVVGPPQPVPGHGVGTRRLGGELQVAYGLLLVSAAVQQACAEAEVEVAVGRPQADELGIMRHGLGEPLLGEELVGLGTQLLVAALAKGQEREEQAGKYARGTGHRPRVGACTGIRAVGFHRGLPLLPARLRRFSSPRRSRPMFSRCV